MALSLVAIMGASSAWASNFVAPGRGAAETTKLNGTRAGIAKHVLTLGGDEMGCSSVSFSSQMTGTATPEISVTPALSGCSWYGYSAGWQVGTGCKYKFHPGSGSGTQSTGTVDIAGCENPITFTFEGCRLEIGNQKQVGTVTYKSAEVEGHGVISAFANLNSITYTRKGTCTSSLQGTFHDGKYTGEWTINGATTEGVPVNLGVEGTAAPAPSAFSVEETPATISGSITSGSAKKMQFTGAAGPFSCKKYSLSGTASSLLSETLTLKPGYSGCKLSGVEIPDNYIEMGGCSFVYHINGTLDIAGTGCESSPMTITRPGCVVVIRPQSGLVPWGGGGFTYLTAGSGRLRTLTLHANAEVEHVKYTTAGPSCAAEGTYTNGQILDSLTPETTPVLTATNSLGEKQGISVE